MTILPRFLFIFSPPYSGTTALAKILNGSSKSMLLNPRGEGQWSVPSLCGKDRWDPAKQVDWELVKRTWLEIYRSTNKLVETIEVIIEKSPPNLVRIRQLLEVFPNSSCTSFIRNPYAVCSSILHRKHSSKPLEGQDRIAAITQTIRNWMFRAGILRETISETRMLHFTYETLCEKPQECIDRVIGVCPELGWVDAARPIKVKDYPRQGIINQNPRQIGLLTEADLRLITKTLREAPGLMEYFGYELLKSS
jgi:Sulfotransferase family